MSYSSEFTRRVLSENKKKKEEYSSDFTKSVLNNTYKPSANDYKKVYNQSQENLRAESSNLKSMYSNAGIVMNNNGYLPSYNKTTFYNEAINPHNYDNNKISNTKVGAAALHDVLAKEKANSEKYNTFKNQKEVIEQTKKVNDAYDDTAIDYYNYLQKKADEHEVNLYDKTLGRAVGGLTSVFDTGLYSLKNEKGEKYIMPTYNDLKNQKVSASYKTGVGKFLGDATFELGRQASSAGLNAIIPGAGTTAYFGSMFTDNWNNAIKEGYDSDKSLVYATLGTGLEVATGKLLGGTTKAVFGTGTSELSEAISKGLSKVITNHPRLVTALSNAISEGGEEFIQEYLDRVNKKLTLGSKDKILTKETFNEAIYSAAVGMVTGGVNGAISPNAYSTRESSLLTQINENQNNINGLTEKRNNNLTDINKVNKIDNQIANSQNNINKLNNELSNYYQSKNQINLPGIENAISSKNDNSNIIKYTQHEIDNFQNGKVKIAQNETDVTKFVEASTKVPSNAKLYFGKIGTNIANKIKSALGINIENYNISLKADSIRHTLNHHSNENEILRGQIPITNDDFKYIPTIISEYDKVTPSGFTNQGKPSITFEKQIGDNYYVVNYVSDKSKSLEVQTMWKVKAKEKNSATVSDANIPKLTSKTDSGTSSFSINNDTTNNIENQVAPLPNIMQNNVNNMQIDNIRETMNPIEISNLTPDNANTTPNLPNVTRNKNNDGDSHFVSNIENKVNMLNEQQKHTILSNDEVKYYDKITNKETLDRAFKKMEGKHSTENWFAKDSNSAEATDVAQGWILLKQYADNNDSDGMVAVAKKMRDMGTKAGQTVQAFNIMERMTPEGMVKYAQSELMEAYDKMVKNKSKEWIDKHRSEFDLKPDEVQFIMDNMKEISTMEDGYDKKVKLAEIQKLMTDKLPPEKGSAIKSWMRISMLFNPKTQVRNVVGNAIIAPVNYFSDMFSSYADKLIAKKTGTRTTGNINVKAILKGFKEGAYQATNDYKKGINTKDMEGNRFEIGESKSFNDKKLIGRSLNRVEGLLNYVMDAGDRVFSQSSFENSLQNQMVLNNTTEVTQDMIDIARSESLQRTWNDNNNYTKFVLDIRRMLNRIGTDKYGLGDILIPFAKTPANITKAIVDYSPVGFVNTLLEGNKLKKSLTNGQYTPQMQHKFVQTLGKATAGTMLYVLGVGLAKAGITSGDSDDDKDVSNFLKNTLGISSYSIKIGDKSFTYDWAQPLAAPLSITANIVNSKNKEIALLESIVGNLDTAGSILLEQSFLTGLNEVLNNNDGVVSGLFKEMLDLPARAIPTFSKQIADLVDGTQRTSYEYGKPIKSALNSMKVKIPGLSKTLAPSVDTMGREIQKYGGKNGIFNVFLNPANVNTENISKSAEEIYRLYKETGNKDIMPRVAPSYINKKGEKIILNSKQKAQYQKESGQIVESSIERLMKTSKYKKLSNADKANTIKEIVNYSYNVAQKKVLGTELSQTYEKAYEYSKIGNISDYYLLKSNIDVDNKKESVSNYLVNSNLSDKEMAKLYGYYYSDEETLNNLVTMKIPIKEYIKLNSEEFTSDYYTSNGKSVSGSRKAKVINYINSLNLSIPQKAILIKSQYNTYKSYDKEIFNYVNKINISANEKKVLLKSIGFKNYNKDVINYINSQNLSIKDKEKKLKSLGFTVRNGRVYS